MGTRAKIVEEALKRKNLRHIFNAIDNNPATPGEVVLWRAGGYAVYSVKQAVKLAQEIDEAERAEEKKRCAIKEEG